MRSLFTFLILLLPISLLAQYQVRSATLIDDNEKTITGFVKFYDWDRSPKNIEFGEDTVGSMTSFSLRSMRKLFIQGGPTYESLYLKVPYYATSPVSIGGNVIDHVDSTYCLAELLLDSESVKLYRFFDQDASVRFVISKNDTLTLLNDIHVQVYRREGRFDITDHEYRRQLRTLLQECPTLKIDNTTYSEKSILQLLKEYLSFCKIDSKIYSEQKKLGTATFLLGTFASLWPTDQRTVIGYGLMCQVLLPRRLNNTFLCLDLGRSSRNSSVGVETTLQLGFYAGKYFGQHAIQGKLYTGFSTGFGFLDTSIGLSYRKMISIETRYPIFSGLLFGFKEDGSNSHIRPALMLRATLPLSSLTRKRVPQ